MIAPGEAESADILAEARKVADAQIERAKQEAETERQRRLEDTRKQIDAETVRAIEQIRGEVADLTVEATQRVVGKVLDADDQRRLIDEAVEGLDFSALEGRSELAARWPSPHAHLRAALYEAAKERVASTSRASELDELPTRSRRRPSSRRSSRTRSSTPTRRRACSTS